MFAILFTSSLMGVWQVSLFVLVLTLMTMILSFVSRSKTLITVTSTLESVFMGIFGVYRCSCPKHGSSYCWLWFGLNSYFSAALAVSFGMLFLALQIAFVLLMLAAGITSIVTLSSPIITYFLYPITLYLLRKKFN